MSAPRRRWIRLTPETLFGRLMGVLVLGLVAALSLSTWIGLSESDDVLRQAVGLQPAQRVADLVELLDPLSPDERERLVRVLDAAPLKVSLSPHPVPMAEAPADLLEPHPGAAAALRLYSSALRTALGDDRPFQVQWLPPGTGRSVRAERRHRLAGERASEPGFDPPADSLRSERPELRPARKRPRNSPGLWFASQVRLADGQWLRLDTRLPHAPDLPLRVLSSISVLLLAVLGLSWWAVRRVTAPLRQLADAAHALGKDLDHPPLPDSGPLEVRRAHQAFNTMQARLRSVVAERTHLLAAVSHDLKTPLTRMKLRAELLDDEALRDHLTRDLDEMTHMVNDTLDFLRGLAQPQRLRPVDLNALLEGLQADQICMGRDVTLSGKAHAPWTGDAARLRRCVGNLLDNAVLYGQRADLTLVDKGSRIEILIRDAGPGIPDELLDQVFEPFFRIEASRNRVTGGSGLGLGIARHIAESAGGLLRLRNHPQGGLEALLSLTRDPSPKRSPAP